MNAILRFVSLFLLVHHLEAVVATYENEDEIELYRQLFVRLNAIVRSNVELKGDILDLKEQLKALKSDSHYNDSNNNPIAVPAAMPTLTASCPSSGKSSTSQVFDGILCLDDNWMLVQKRYDGSQDFDRSWAEYKAGFGQMNGEFFIGLEKLHALTASKPYELLILLKDFDNEMRYAKYDHFVVDTEAAKYRLKSLGTYSGTAGDSLSYHLNAKFSTQDQDNDEQAEISCARKFGGGWWYRSCHHSNLNGHYVKGDHSLSYASGLHWKTFHGKWYSLKASQMLIRPKS